MAKVNLPEGFTRWKPAKSPRQNNGLPLELMLDSKVAVIFNDGSRDDGCARDWVWDTRPVKLRRICGYKKVS